MQGVKQAAEGDKFVVPDSREGWVESLRLQAKRPSCMVSLYLIVTCRALQLEAYFCGYARPVFDYSLVRPRGQPIKGFGGTASGPEVPGQTHLFSMKYWI